MNFLKTVWKQSKWTLIIAALILVALFLFQQGSLFGNKLLIMGAGMNVELTEEGAAWLREALTEKLRGPEGFDAQYESATMYPFSDQDKLNENYYLLENILDLCRRDSLDYFVMDQVALENLIPQQLFLDLRNFFTEEELTQWHDSFIWAVAVEEGKEADMDARVPIGLRLDNVPFFQECAPGQQLFFGISKQSSRITQLRVLWDHILSWE